MKGAAKCDNRCELQNYVNQWPLERALRSWDMPESMSASVLLLSFSAALVFRSSAAACFCNWHWHAKYQVSLAVVLINISCRFSWRNKGLCVPTLPSMKSDK